MNKFHCVPTRNPDGGVFSSVRDAYATDAALRADIDDAIHGWSGEASGGVNIKVYPASTSEEQDRADRWDLFTILLHELMHVVQHPNYVRTYSAIAGEAKETLKEGFPDVMRHDLWDGPGQLETRIGTDAYDPLRRTVEGDDYSYDQSLIHAAYHSDYPIMYPKAKEIVYGGGGHAGVGIANAKAAFFLGHTELLGLGEGTATGSGASLGTTAPYKSADSVESEIVVAQAGDTVEKIRQKTNGTAGILDAETSKPLAAGVAIAAGKRLRVPGVSHVYTIEEDTLASIAKQHDIGTAELLRANDLPVATPADHTFPAGTWLLIPAHAARK